MDKFGKKLKNKSQPPPPPPPRSINLLSSRQSSEIALSEFPEKHKAEMASQISQQYACKSYIFLDISGFFANLTCRYAVRAQKSLGLVNGTPDYSPVAGFIAPDVPARMQNYSADGRLYAYALPNV